MANLNLYLINCQSGHRLIYWQERAVLNKVSFIQNRDLTYALPTLLLETSLNVIYLFSALPRAVDDFLLI